MVKEINDEEMAAVSKLKIRMSNVPKDEMYGNDSLFYRFLKARDFNIDNAEKMLRDHLEWRKKYDVKNCSKWKLPEVLEKYLPYNKVCQDKEGSTVRYVPCGNLDWKGVAASCKFEDFEKYFIKIFEGDMEEVKLNEESEKTVWDSKRFVFIYDMENFSFAQATNKKGVSYFTGLLNLFFNNYPETMKCSYNINVSSYFHLAYNIVEKLFPNTVKDKITIYSDDTWKKDLAKIIDPELLPAFLGGKRTDPDGNALCNTFINRGGPVPENYYIHRSKRSLSSFPDVKQLTLPRAMFKEVFVNVKEPECYLEWEFETETRDIGFGLFFEDAEGNTKEIVPIMRINTEEFAETGLYRCEKAGKYIVIFDNTFSVLRSKDVYYRIRVKKGQEEENEIVK